MWSHEAQWARGATLLRFGQVIIVFTVYPKKVGSARLGERGQAGSELEKNCGFSVSMSATRDIRG